MSARTRGYTGPSFSRFAGAVSLATVASVASCAARAPVVQRPEAQSSARPHEEPSAPLAVTVTQDPLERVVSTAQIDVARVFDGGMGPVRQNPVSLLIGLVGSGAALRVVTRGAEGGHPIDYRRPVRTYTGALDDETQRLLEQLDELATVLPAQGRDDEMNTAADGESGARFDALTQRCPAGGFAERVVVPAQDSAATERFLRESLEGDHWQAVEVAGATYLRYRENHALVRLVTAPDAVLLEGWVEPLESCQSAGDRAAFVPRAVAHLRAIRAEVPGVAPGTGEDSAVFESDERATAYAGMAIGLNAALTAVGRGSASGPSIAPQVVRRLLLQGLREADSPVRMINDGARFRRVKLSLLRTGASRGLRIESEPGDDATAVPAEALWQNSATMVVADARDALDVRLAWLDGFTAARDASALLQLRREGGWGGVRTALPLVFAAALRSYLDGARPAGAPWPAAERIDRVLVATHPSDAAHPVSVALLAAGTTAQQAACALAPATPCTRAQALTAATRPVSGGFARLFTRGERYAVALCAARAPLDALALRGAVSSSPASGVFSGELAALASLGQSNGPTEFTTSRDGARMVIDLRPRAPR